jgi:hypothetical protein
MCRTRTILSARFVPFCFNVEIRLISPHPQILTTNLRPVATQDPSSLDPPRGRLNFICRSLKISPFEERLVISGDALNHLKRAGAGPPIPLSQINFEAGCVRLAAHCKSVFFSRCVRPEGVVVKSGWALSRPLHIVLQRKRLQRSFDQISLLHPTILSKFWFKALETESDTTTDSLTSLDHILSVHIDPAFMQSFDSNTSIQ